MWLNICFIALIWLCQPNMSRFFWLQLTHLLVTRSFIHCHVSAPLISFICAALLTRYEIKKKHGKKTPYVGFRFNVGQGNTTASLNTETQTQKNHKFIFKYNYIAIQSIPDFFVITRNMHKNQSLQQKKICFIFLGKNFILVCVEILHNFWDEYDKRVLWSPSECLQVLPTLKVKYTMN